MGAMAMALLAACGGSDGLRLQFFDVPEEQRAELRAEAGRVVDFYARRFGIDELDVTVRVAADQASFREAITSAGLERIAFDRNVGCFAYAERIFVRLDHECAQVDGVLAHEYFHSLQWRLAPDHASGRPRDRGPVWLVEGTAEYVAGAYREAAGLETSDPLAPHTGNADALRALYESEVTLRNVEADPRQLTGPWVDRDRYLIGSLAAHLLARRAGEQALLDYFRLLPERTAWPDAFGVSVADFRREVDTRRTALVAEVVRTFDAIHGTVLGPDGEGLGGVVVRAWGGDEGAFVYGVRPAGYAVAGPGGLFVLPVAEDGEFVLTVHRPLARGCRPIGWYARGTGSGFAADARDASPVTVDGGDADGIVIRLPGSPEHLPNVNLAPRHCAR